MLALNRERCAEACERRGVAYRQTRASVFDWQPGERHDVAFFGFWLSHVPEARFDAFWGLVRDALRPGGRALFVDSLPADGSGARDHGPVEDDGVACRSLNDGRSFRIVKIFHRPEALAARLDALGFDADITTTGEFFLLGSARPRSRA